jgi:hypothetical protein
VKNGTENKLKFKKLQAKLGLKLYEVKGILQSIWDFAGDNCILGNIGRDSNEDICFAIEYDGDPDQLILSLYQAGWLDYHQTERLVIHDWHEHAEDRIKKRVERLNRENPEIRFYSTDSIPYKLKDMTEFIESSSVRQNPTVSENGGQSPTMSADIRQNQPTADNGGQCPTKSADVRQNPTTAENGRLPKPLPLPKPEPLPEPEPRDIAHLADEPPPEKSPDPQTAKKTHRKPDGEKIYQAYPRKVGKEKALASIRKAVKSIQEEEGVSLEDAEFQLLEIVKDYAESPKVKNSIARGEREFIPHPTTWFNQGRWKDDRAEWGYGVPPPQRGQAYEPPCELDKAKLPASMF